MQSDRVQEELSRVVGKRQVRVEDRKNLPYVEAVIHETQRMANIVPMSLPHRTSRDTTFQGYFIEKVHCLLLTHSRLHCHVVVHGVYLPTGDDGHPPPHFCPV